MLALRVRCAIFTFAPNVTSLKHEFHMKKRLFTIDFVD